MLNETGASIGEMLTEQEKESIRFAHTFYGARAKQAALELGAVAGLSEEESQHLVGGVALQMERLDAEQRKDLASSFLRITVLLGIAGDSALSRTIALDLITNVNGDETVEIGTIVEQDISLYNGPFNGSEHDQAIPQPQVIIEAPEVEEHGQLTENGKTNDPLTPMQRRWLLRVLEQDIVDQIEQLPLHQRLDFAANLGKLYCDLKIPRLTPKNKKDRVEQLVAFIAGFSYKAIGQLNRSSPDATAIGLRTMSETIAKRLPREEILAAIPSNTKAQKVNTPRQEAGASAIEETIQLTKIQESWLLKVLGPVFLEEASNFTSDQRARLTSAISKNLRAYIVRREGPVRTDRRVAQMGLLIEGSSYEQIAAKVGQPVSTVKSELHKSASTLANRLTTLDLKKIKEACLEEQY